MNVTEAILKQRKVLLVALIAIAIGGMFSFFKMGKLEDAEITVKSALVITQYPGASQHEVELRVTDVLETAIQSMDNIDFIESRSMAGYSEISVNLSSTLGSDELPQVWDLLRRKVNDTQVYLPQGASTSMVFDDYGDVYGIFLALSGEGFSGEELQDYARYIKREVLLIDGVKRINLFGEEHTCVNIELSQEKMAFLGIHPYKVVELLNNQNKMIDPGSLKIGTDRVRITSNGSFQQLEDLKNLLVSGSGSNSVFLKDIARIKKDVVTPYLNKLKYNQMPAIGIAVAMEKGGNVIELGERIQKKIDELTSNLPVGINLNKVFYQPERVSSAINVFIINLIESVLIVIIVLLFAMGFRTGLLIGSGLVFTILATFIVMLTFDIALQRVSLGAIIIAMGMLVDNAIVIADGILIDLKKGVRRKEAMIKTSKQTAIPLLGATLVAILAFLPIYLSPDSTGEFCASLFIVIAISLFLSWLLSLTQTPYFCDLFLKGDKYSKNHDNNTDPYSGKFYQLFKSFIKYSLKHKITFTLITIALFISSIFAFFNVKQLFMPNLAYNQFVVEYFLPNGSDINSVEKELKELETYLLTQEDVVNVTTSLGATPARYTLVRPITNNFSNYGELIVDTKDYEGTKRFGKELQDYVSKNYSWARCRVRYYSPISSEYMIEAKFSGPDPEVLRDLADKAQEIMKNEPRAVMVTNNWNNTVKVWNPTFSQAQARSANITRADVSNALACATTGLPIGLFHQAEDMLPILLKTKSPESQYVEALENTPIWGNNPQSIPLRQVVSDIDIQFEDSTIKRYNRRRAIKAQCDPAPGYNAPDVFNKLHRDIEAIPLPEGYDFEWLGEHKDSKDAQDNMNKFLPLAFFFIFFIILLLFNNFRQPIIVLSVLPLAFIGVSYGLLLTGKAFGFMAILGTLGLMGMMIKNAVVLLDQINLEIAAGKDMLNAIIDSAVSRMRPVIMASFTTILGMIPLISDELFGGMAVAIMFGLLIGSIITLIIIPILYAIFYRVSTKNVMN
ncbi:efflux RND transporter permease subunit [Ancylomarina salipaludis]|uniref:Efflux RND transporter permease subunit n=1 Tax=Ancylomarina salipaludis TaxID=2501299 RepID=A0A4Q1JI51_9BACT|nr:efflux RND transporter permease subunit [Ancylomarina salipaludis]RXQ88155.1 efflux RND transporter permease subunit [Ancylomarina salipaludis]